MVDARGQRVVYEKQLWPQELLPCELPVQAVSDEDVARWVERYRTQDATRQLAMEVCLDNDDPEYNLYVSGGGVMKVPGKSCCLSVLCWRGERVRMLLIVHGKAEYDMAINKYTGAFEYDLSVYRLLFCEERRLSRLRVSEGNESWWDDLPRSPVLLIPRSEMYLGAV